MKINGVFVVCEFCFGGKGKGMEGKVERVFFILKLERTRPTILAVCLDFLGFQLVQLSSVFVSKLTSSSVRQMCHGLIYTNISIG